MYGYDYIVNDLFHFNAAGNAINYSFNLRNNQDLLTSLSEDLVKKMGFEPAGIQVIVALLFI